VLEEAFDAEGGIGFGEFIAVSQEEAPQESSRIVYWNLGRPLRCI
jgi:hypothetical protein